MVVHFSGQFHAYVSSIGLKRHLTKKLKAFSALLPVFLTLALLAAFNCTKGYEVFFA